MTTKRGDTLLEVVLAFVIFSLVMTIAIVSMNAGITKLEGALELSLTRTEIDAQAEALRFVHNAYVRNPSDEEGTYYQLWTAITDQANDNMASIPDLQPETCSSLYENGERSIYSAHAFALNARDIHPRSGDNPDLWTSSLVKAEIDDGVFTPTELYPRLVYTVPDAFANAEMTTDDLLLEVDHYTELKRVEGLYVTAVRGADETFWDFYIYTCFSEPGATHPTTIGTTVRLYDPDI